MKKQIENQAFRIDVFGLVQGVGMRPLVFTLARECGLNGYVSNQFGALVIYLQCPKSKVNTFISLLHKRIPQIAHIARISISKAKYENYKDFRIIHSQITPTNTLQIPHIPLDLRICDECLKDLATHPRFLAYPFTTCTQCGARYSIIHTLPYDRIRTSMRDFPMCEMCKSEYENPHNRRFHAQPISCVKCPIGITVYENGKQKPLKNEAIFTYLAKAILKGQILAIKGVGGFNLIANANDINAIRNLRIRKNRPHKPFAIMFKNINDIDSIAFISPLERVALTSRQAPIVLLNRKDNIAKNAIIPPQCLDLLAPDVASIGAILPYNAIMHLLFKYVNVPLIFTSANLSGEPIIADFESLESTLKNVYDVALDYKRTILNPIDDSIVRLMAGAMRCIRLARGFAPMKLDINTDKTTSKNEMILGVGAQQKAHLCFMLDAKHQSQVLLTPYIGDLDSIIAQNRFRKAFSTFCLNLPSKITTVAYDLHPQYDSTVFAKELIASKPLKNVAISHHKAHFYAVLGQSEGLDKNALGIIWDGTGLGEDGHIWGGECFYFNKNDKTMSRIAHFEEFLLVGNDVKHIDKIALSLLMHCNEDISHLKTRFDESTMSLFQSAYKRGIGTLTSSVGRLFDAIAYMIGGLESQTYEGQSGAIIESLALSYALKHKNIKPYRIDLQNGIIGLKSIISGVLNDVKAGEKQKSAYRFILTLAHIALRLARHFALKQEIVYFSGGVFQNKLLCDKIHTLFTRANKSYKMHEQIPCNDACIGFGQVLYASFLRKQNGAK